MNGLVPKAYLAIAGLTAACLGALILLAPAAFYASYGLDVGGQVSLLSELRSHALLLFGAGAFISTALFIPRLTNPALAASAAVYLSYSLSRLIGVALDGLPAGSFQIAGAIEMLLGITGLILFAGRSRLKAASA